ncbi:MAG TPA: hypothetical protein VGR53_00525 [Nitrososphaerales archaeon]|nr:hypothetical protein [Nitrososphaerales archaeon]
MNERDQILVTIKDTPDGLETIVKDETSGISGFMVASASNGFENTSPNLLGPCSTNPFSFHPLYDTAKVTNYAGWTGNLANVNLAFEIGHSAYSYQAVWPNGSPNNPSSIIIGAPSGNGIGPMSFNGISFANPYSQMQFSTTQATNAGAFYPFYAQAGKDSQCVLNFGNDIPGVTTNDFGQTSQYTNYFLKLLGLGVISNPCLPAPATTTTTTSTISTTAIITSTSATSTTSGLAVPEFPLPTLVVMGLGFAALIVLRRWRVRL